jgi:DNA replicative helicase MCM subunit Mcm2 (Cdc46/Mcm family)
MDCTVFKCKDCGIIMVVDNKSLWYLKACTKCGSTNISTLDEEFNYDEEFDYMGVVDVEQSKED